MKNIKFILPVIIVAVLIPPFQSVIYSLIGIVAIMAVCFLVYGTKSKININLKVPKLLKIFIMIFFAINIAYTKFILLSSSISINIETASEYSFGKILILIVVVILGSAISEIFVYHIFGTGVKRIAYIHFQFASDSLMQKFLHIDYEVKAEKITKEKAASLKTELQTELNYYSSINNILKFTPVFFLISYIISLLSIVGSRIISFFTRTIDLKTFEWVVNHFAHEMLVFPLILSLASIGVAIKEKNHYLKK